MEGFGIFSGIIGVAIIVLGILALLMPFFVMQIRDSSKRIERKMDRIISLMDKSGTDESISEVVKEHVSDDDWAVIRCRHCGAKNRAKDTLCINCSKPIFLRLNDYP